MDLKLNFDKRDHAQTIQGWVIPISGVEEIAQRIRLRLTIRRGSFPLDPELGSRLYALPRGNAAQMNAAARDIIEEALAPMPGVRLDSVSCTYDPEADKAVVTCRFIWSGQDIPITTEV